MDDNVLVHVPDETEAPGELTEEDKDFLKSLEKMAEEAMDEVDGSN